MNMTDQIQQRVAAAPSRIRALVARDFSDHQDLKVVDFVDAMAGLAVELGSINCSLADQRTLSFRSNGELLCEVQLPFALTALRMSCARLAKIIQERGGQEFKPYGNNAEVDTELRPGQRVRLRIAFTNTTAHQEFTIEARPV